MSHGTQMTDPLKPEEPKPEEPKLGRIIFLFFWEKKILLFCTGIFILYWVGKLFDLGSFGCLSFVFGGLLLVTAHEYFGPSLTDEKPNSQWITLLLVPTILTGFFEARFLMKQQAATDLTRAVSGEPEAWAECQRWTPALFSDALTAGYHFPAQGKKAVLQYIYCNEWGNFYYSDPNTIQNIQPLWAVGTVIHEAVHVTGEFNEAVTQCLTAKAFPNILRRLGVSEDKVQIYVAQYAQASTHMPTEYLYGKCDDHALLTKRPEIFGSK